jgi:L-fuconolactonase
MTDRPTRVVDAHVHIWDPARTDWYPYLSHPQAPEPGQDSGMFRAFDIATYRGEAVRWNVDKFVNVAAATGGHSIAETLELNDRAPANGGPDAIVGDLWEGSKAPYPTSVCCKRCRNGICCSS